MKTTLIFVSLTIAALAAIVRYGRFRWVGGTRKLRSRMEASRLPVKPLVVDFSEFEVLPAPVQRYLRKVLKEGQPTISSACIKHEGTFNLGRTTDVWKAFTSEQWVTTRRPGFDWDARVRMMPGLTIRVHDAYIAGEGELYAALHGLFPLVNLHGIREIAEGELMRFFAEAVWYPTAFLPSQGVVWESVDARSARATLVDGAIAITMLFSFNEECEIESVRAEARGRTVGDQILPTPWQGRFWNYKERAGMQVPLDGEVAWLLPEGEKPYWRGHVTEIEYEFAKQSR